MQIFKCKMCGGELNVEEGQTIYQCEYCGTKQTLPRLDDERKANLYDRANHFRRNNEYDKAMSIYEQILEEDKTDAEAYWSIVLCRYGIEYVEDTASHKRVPTVNRTQYTSILADEDYKSALLYADDSQRELYEQEAKAIDEIQKGILTISQQESPFDVFICYKETDSRGRRTQDSVLAQDLYYGLKNEGFKVFFSRITLEDKLGSAYEPYIFAALNSAKVMVVLGTKAEHFNSVWVKNEWSRFLSLIAKGEKKMLIPAYKDMNPYDLPEEFSHLQAQDMSKLGFMQDLMRGIKKILWKDKPREPIVQQVTVNNGNQGAEALLKRAFLFLEDGDFDSANEYTERVLDINPECSQAYIAKLLIDLLLHSVEELNESCEEITQNVNFQKAMRFADAKGRTELENIAEQCLNNNREKKYHIGLVRLKKKEYDSAKSIFKLLGTYRDSASKVQECTELKQKQTRKKKKRIIGIIIGIAVVLLGIVLAGSIKSWVFNQDLKAKGYLQLSLSESGEEYIVTGVGDSVEKNNGIVVIPEKYEGKPITSIGDSAFEDCSGLKSTTIPDSVTSIGQNAFYGCSSLKSITIPDSVTSIGKASFQSCSSLTSVTIGDSVTSIGDEAFDGCSSLTSISIPDRVTSIGDETFDGCSGLTSVTIPDSVTCIGWAAFYNCSSLTSIVIPDSVTSIGDSAFFGCSGLTSVTIPDSVTSIGDSTFSGCDNLTSVIIPDSVTNIEERAFDGCSSLTSVTIPDSVTSIGKEAFYNCSSLTSIAIPDNVTSIDIQTFVYCGGLTSVTISDSVTSIRESAFYGCNNLQKVYYGGTETQWNTISINNYGGYNSSLLETKRYYYSVTQPTTSGNYWHYVDGKITEW